MPLDLPLGDRCFVDANILVYEFIDTPPFTSHVKTLMSRLARQEILAYTSSLIVAEALHRIMLAEVIQHFHPTSSPLAYVQRRPQIISQLPIYAIAAARIANSGIHLLPIDPTHFVDATKITATHHLLTNDACIIAAMTAARLQNLITNDDDFDQVPSITLWKPR